MPGIDPATGVTTPHGDTVVPLHDGPGIDATAGVTPVDGLMTPADQTPVTPYAAMLAEDMATGEADCRAAQASAMGAENDRRSHYASQALPLGGQVGDNVVLPVVPDNATVPASSDGYPWPGDEPTPSGVGPSYQGNEPG